MKHGAWIDFVVAMLMVVCSSCSEPKGSVRPADTSLSAIDSLLWSQPDSAFARLQDFDANHGIDSLDTFNRHYFHLLLSELLYKNDYPQTNRNELLQAEAFFDSLVSTDGPRVRNDLAFLDARVHYIDGVGYYEMDSVVPACEQYLKALELMEERFTEEELVGRKAQFMALAFTHLTMVFSDQYLHEQAIVFGKQSLPYYHKYCAEPWHEWWVLDEIGSQYDMMKQRDSAYCYYQKAYHSLPDTTGLAFRDTKTHLLLFSSKKGMLETQDVLFQLYSLLSSAESEKEYCARCLAIGEVLYSTHQLDSALVYLNEAYEKATSIGVKKQSAEWLADICNKKGNDSDVFEYSSFLASFANQEENKSAIKTQLTTLHHVYEQKRMEFMHERKTHQTHQTVNWIIWALLFAVLLVFLLFSKRIKNERFSHSITLAAMGGRLKQSNKLLRDKTQQLERVNDSLLSVSDHPEPKANYAAFIQSPICQQIINLAEEYNFKPKTDYLIYKSIALDKKQLKALMETADTQLGQFPVRVRIKYPSLTNDDVIYCCLYLLGLNEADISALMQRAYSTVCERNRKIKRILGTDADLSAALRNLL
ncbi:MAG: hypothetical protein J5831_05510 [Bacteroidales bacterium]|nr:hypothetical protein [Bacteroidales bacterium]